MTTRIQRPSGFTLIEVLVVILIVVLVATLAGIALVHAVDKARQRATMADMRRIATAIESYQADHRTPPQAADVSELVELLGDEYGSDLPQRDEWGNLLEYRTDGSGGWSIESPGKDGVAGSDITLSTRFDFDLDIVMIDGRFVAAPE